MGFAAQAIAGVFIGIFGYVMTLLGTVTGAFLGAAVGIFNWVTSESFISLSYTRLDNPFIEVGWTLTRDLTNVFFVLALVVIGIATILRYNTYQAQKTLPVLIIIALLINFTPVLLGLAVDATNILMKFFIQGGFNSGNSFANYALRQWANTSAMAGGLKLWDPTSSQQAIAAFASSAILTVFNLMAALVYLLFAFLFIFRYIAIWALVIFSPFAFACYILPATRSIWNAWWKQFFQWSTIGITAAFFLYLSEQLLKASLGSGFISSLPENPNSGNFDFSGIFNNIMPYFVSLAFLFIGLTMALSSSAMGSSLAISWAKKSGKFAKGIAQKRALNFARQTMPGRGMMEKIGKRMETAKTWGAGQTGIKGGLKRAVSTPLFGTARVAGKRITDTVGAPGRKADALKLKADAEKIQDENAMAKRIQDAKSSGGNIDELAVLASVAVKKEFGRALEAISPAEAVKMIKTANDLGMKDEAGTLSRGFMYKIAEDSEYKGNPEKMREAMGFAVLDETDERKGYKNIMDKLIGDAKGEGMKDFGKNLWKNPEAMEAIQKFWGGPQLAFAANEFGRTFVDIYMEKAEEKYKKDPDSFIRENPKRAMYLAGNASQNLGYMMPGGLEPKDVKTAIKGINQQQKPEFTPEEQAVIWRKAVSKRQKISEAEDNYRNYKKKRAQAKEKLVDTIPSPDADEIKKFKTIAEGKKPIPKPRTKLVTKGLLRGKLREVQGALRESFSAIRQIDNQIAETEYKLQLKQEEKAIEIKKGTSSDPNKIIALDSEISNLENDLQDFKLKLGGYERREDGLAIEEDDIKRKLTAKVKKGNP